MLDLKQVFSLYPGEDEVYFKIIENGKAKIIKTAFKVANGKKLIDELEKHFSELLKIAK